MVFPETIEAITIPMVRRLLHATGSADVHLLQHGDVNVIEKTTLPFPTVRPGEIVVKVLLRTKRLAVYLKLLPKGSLRRRQLC